MGGNSSKSAVQQTNEFFNKTTNSFISENSQKVAASSVNMNAVKIQGKFKGCTIDVNQDIDATVVATGSMEIENVNELTAKLKTDASTAIDNAAATKSGFLSPSVANSSTATTNLKTTVTNIIENTMASKNVQDIFAAGRNNNAATLEGLDMECTSDMPPELRVLKVNQAIKSSVMAKGVANALTKALADVVAENTVVTDVKQTATTENKGLDDLVTAIFSGLAGIYGVYAIILICCCCICCWVLLGVVVMGSGGGANMNIPKPPAAIPGGVTLSAAPPV